MPRRVLSARPLRRRQFDRQNGATAAAAAAGKRNITTVYRIYGGNVSYGPRAGREIDRRAAARRSRRVSYIIIIIILYSRSSVIVKSHILLLYAPLPYVAR